jgi:hypothetical protein
MRTAPWQIAQRPLKLVQLLAERTFMVAVADVDLIRVQAASLIG